MNTIQLQRQETAVRDSAFNITSSDNPLQRRVWNFIIALSGEHIIVSLSSFHEQSRLSETRPWNDVQCYLRYGFGDLKHEEVPFPEIVLLKAKKCVQDSVRIVEPRGTHAEYKDIEPNG